MPTFANQSAPYAIAMWDTGWLTRHYRYGSFEDWDRVLDELVDRGYNAVRIDAFPHLVAADSRGEIRERFFRSRGKSSGNRPLMLEHPWRNAWSTYLEPRAGLAEFLPKCRDRGVRVGLSTWFPDVQEGRHDDVQGLDNFVRIWDETLRFLADRDLLDDNILYVDLLNEYLLFHATTFSWLLNYLQTLSAPRPEAGRDFNAAQTAWIDTFAVEAVQRLKALWPALTILFSFSRNPSAPWQELTLDGYGALDVHLWMVTGGIGRKTGYFDTIQNLNCGDEDYGTVCQALHAAWREEQDRLTEWMRGEMREVAETGTRLGIPYGNTEGWGPIFWREHPLLDWDFCKEAGLVGARLGAELGYAFNCSSNFTHPQFRGLWDDVDWHREVTGIIRAGHV